MGRPVMMPAAIDIAVMHQGLPPGAPAPGGQPPAGAASWQQVLAGMLGPMAGQGRAAAAAAGGAAGAAAARAPGAAGAAAQQQQQQPAAVRLNIVDGQGQAVPAAVPLVAVPPAPGGAPPAMPPELAGMAQTLLAQLGVSPSDQAQLLGQFGGIVRALRQSSRARCSCTRAAASAGCCLPGVACLVPRARLALPCTVLPSQAARLVLGLLAGPCACRLLTSTFLPFLPYPCHLDSQWAPWMCPPSLARSVLRCSAWWPSSRRACAARWPPAPPPRPAPQPTAARRPRRS